MHIRGPDNSLFCVHVPAHRGWGVHCRMFSNISGFHSIEATKLTSSSQSGCPRGAKLSRFENHCLSLASHFRHPHGLGVCALDLPLPSACPCLLVSTLERAGAL